jgi:hypothetical protein
MAIEHFAGVCRRHALLAADQQLAVEIGLQRRHLLAERGLRDVQGRGRAREASGFDDLQKGPESTRIHDVSAYPASIRTR